MKIDRADRKTALQFLGVSGGSHNEEPADITALIEKYEPLLLDVISPRYAYRAFEAAEYGNLLLLGNDIREHLKGCEKIILFAATLGLPADELIRKAEAVEMSGAVVLDALASAVIEQVCDHAEAEIKRKYSGAGILAIQGAKKKTITSRFSPGYGDFPLEVQHELTKIIGAKRKIGLHVTKDGLLIPRKSVTAVIGVL